MEMGIFNVEIMLSNPVHPELSALKVSALVDSGSMHLCLPKGLVLQLGLEELDRRPVTFADGRQHLCP
jgi:hypothetical protein